MIIEVNNNILEKFLIRANDTYTMNECVLQQGFTRMFSVGDISVITGQPKSRKTFLVSAIITAYLSDYGYLGLNSDSEGSVLLIDTEQAKYHVQNVVKRIYRLLHWNFEDNKDDKFRVLSLRGELPEDMMKESELAIQTFKPKLVIIDGFADLLRDTNSLEESTERVSDLMRFSTLYQCHISTVVHTNPNSEKMRGHVGSELQRKAESVLLVTKSEEITTISPQFCRNIEFNKFSFRINENGLPIACEYIPSPEDNSKILFETIFSNRESMKFTELRTEVMRKLSIKESASEKRIRRGLELGIIEKNDTDYKLKYEDVESEEMPF